MHYKRMVKITVVVVFFVTLLATSVYTYHIIHGDTTIPQVQRYSGEIPWQKGGVSLLLILFCVFILFSHKLFPIEKLRFRIGWRRYKVELSKDGWRSKITFIRVR